MAAKRSRHKPTIDPQKKSARREHGNQLVQDIERLYQLQCMQLTLLQHIRRQVQDGKRPRG
jgi:hypothetical protein